MIVHLKSMAKAAAVLGIVGGASMLVAGQAAQQPAVPGGDVSGAAATQGGATPRLSNGKPDLSGHWGPPYVPNMAVKDTVLDPKTRQPLTFPRMGEALPGAAAPAVGTAPRTYDLPYTAWGLRAWIRYDPIMDGEYTGNCLPFGMSRYINAPFGMQILHTPDALAFMFEVMNWFHWVPTNGMNWPVDLPDTWNGLSTGHWDGDTLVIETTRVNGYAKLDTAGHPHSKELKLTNTFLRTDAETVQHTVIVHDPKTYVQDWMNSRTWKLKKYPDVIMEYSCQENNGGLFDGSITRWRGPDIEE